MNVNQNDEHRYDDIINLPHHVSKVHPRMTMQSRAAQFSPFAALTGYDAAVRETERLTDARIELDDSEKERLAQRLQMLIESEDNSIEARFTWFQPDGRKAGGQYITKSGILEAYDALKRSILLEDGTRIPLDDLYRIDAALFHRPGAEI